MIGMFYPTNETPQAHLHRKAFLLTMRAAQRQSRTINCECYEHEGLTSLFTLSMPAVSRTTM